MVSAESTGTHVGAVEMDGGPLVWAGKSLYSYTNGSLVESVGFSADYSADGIGFGDSVGPVSTGVTQLGDGRLVLVRTVIDSDPEAGQESRGWYHEVVAARVGDSSVETEILFACAEVLRFGAVSDGPSVNVACVVNDPETDEVWLAGGVPNPEGEGVDHWEHRVAGRPQAWAVSKAGSGAVAVVGLSPESLEPVLSITDGDGTNVRTVTLGNGLKRPARMFSIRMPEGDAWLIEWWEDAGTRHTLTTSDGKTTEVTDILAANPHGQVIAVGDVVPESPGDEVVLNHGSADGESRRTVVATVSDGAFRELFELSSSSVSAAQFADINGDGLLDVVCVEGVAAPQQFSHRSIERMGVWLWNGSGFDPPRYSGDYDAGVASFDSVDIDGDGRLELIVGYDDLSVERARVDILRVN